MHFLDMRTVLFSYIISNLICMVVAFMLWMRNRKRFAGPGFWLADFIAQFVAIILVVLRGAIPDLLSMTVSNSLVIGGTILLYLGLERFVGNRGPQWQNLVLLAVFIPAHAYFVIHPDLSVRNILFALALLAICAQIAWLMLRRVESQRLSITWTVGITMVAYCLLSTVRIVLEWSMPSGNDFFASSTSNTLIILLYQMLFIGLTFGLSLMVNLRLTKSLEDDIRARLAAEAASKFSEEKFQKAFHSSPDVIIITRLVDGDIVEVNEGFTRVTGYARDEAVGNSTVKLKLWANPEDRETLVKILLGQLRIENTEYDFRAKSGKIINGLFTGEVIQLNNEPHIITVVHDITERKRTETALKESEQKYRLLFETMANGVVYQDQDGKITSANPAAEKILGLTLDQMQGRTSIDPRWRSIHEDGSPFAGDTHPSMVALRTGQAISNVVMGVFNPATDEYHWLNINAVPQFKPGETKPYQVYTTFGDITERKRVEAALRESNERNSAFISQSFEAIYRTEFDDPIDISLPLEEQIDLIYENAYMAECNQALADMYHLPSVDVMIGMRLVEAHGGKDNPLNRAAFRKLIKGGYKSFNDETMEKDANGNPIWFLSNTIGIVEDGYLVRLWGTSINITEHKQVEEALRLEQEFVKNALDTQQDTFFLFDFISGKTLRWNRAFREISGYSDEEIAALPAPVSYYSAEDLARESTGIQRIKQGEPATIVMDLICKDGRKITTEYQAASLKDEIGDYRFIIAIGRDITERKQAEELVQLRLRLIQYADSHSLDELLQKTLDEAEALTDSRIGFFHFVEQDQNSLSLQAWSTRTVQEFCKAEGKGMHYDLAKAGVWVDCVREGRPIVHNDYDSLPNRRGMPDGHARVMRELVVPVFRDDQIMAIVGVGNKPKNYTERDVEIVTYIADVVWETTARKRAEEDTLKLNAELERRVVERTAALEHSNRELEALSYNIAHDMRSPARTLTWYATQLQESQGDKLDEHGLSQLGKIIHEAKRLGILIDGFLDYLRLGRVAIRKQTVDMEKLVDKIKRRLLVEKSDPNRQIQVVTGNLPQCQADPRLIDEVWTRLLDNAIKFTRTRALAQIEIGAGERDGVPYYFIRDNGIGFEMKYADKIFVLFQFLNSQAEYEGNGIGLAVVQRVIQRLGGHIWVESESGNGATFYFTV